MKPYILEIAAELGVEADKLNAAFEAKQVVTLLGSELESRDKANKSTGYSEGKVAGVEMLIKEHKETLGLQFEGKDPAKFIEALQAKTLADAKVTPNAALAEKESVINQLRQNISTLEAEKQRIAQEKENVLLHTSILQHVPNNLKAVKADEAIALMKANGYDFKREGDQLVVTKGGEVVKTTTDLKPLPVSEVVTSYAKERGWLADEGAQQRQGRGAGSSNPGTSGAPSKMSEAEKAWKESGKHIGDVGFSAYVANIAKENPSFDYNS